MPRWNFDASVQYSPDSQPHRALDRRRALLAGPVPHRRPDLPARRAACSEQVELGWQWPVYGRGPRRERRRAPARGSGSCSGTLYSVGRVNYSTRDSRLTDSIVGFEYDAGCWIGRVVAERLSTGRSEATTRLLLQLELVGLSRLGSNPLRVLKDNIPGYRLLREERTTHLTVHSL